VATPPFGKIFGDHVQTVPGNMCVKLEVGRCAQTDRQTDRHTSNERIISAIHFVHLAEIKTCALRLCNRHHQPSPLLTAAVDHTCLVVECQATSGAKQQTNHSR